MDEPASKRRIVWVGVAILALAFGLGAVLENRRGETVVAANYTGWPFEAASGVLSCENRQVDRSVRSLVTLRLGEDEYGLNAAAAGPGGYVSINKVLPKDSERFGVEPGALALVNRLIARGLELCSAAAH